MNMNTNMYINRMVKRTVAFLLCLITLFSVLSFADCCVLQLAVQAHAEEDLAVVSVAPTYEKKFDKKLYNALLKELDAQLETKKFSKKANSFFRELLKLEVENYPQWRTVYKDLPAPKSYIRENLINVIPLIGKLKLIDADSPEGRVYVKKSGFEGRTTIDGKKSNMVVLYRDPKKLDEYEKADQLGTFAHELRHVHDRACSKKTSFPTKALRKIILEGAASFHERFALPIETSFGGTAQVVGYDDSMFIFKCDRNSVYPYYQTFYDVLVYLAGYNVLNAVGKGKSLETIKTAVLKNYDSDTSQKLWGLLQNLPLMADDDIVESKKAYHAVNTIFSLLMLRVKRDIKKLDKKQPEKIRKFMDVYRNIKMKVLADRFVYDGEEFNPVRYGDWGITDACLVDKIIASKALPVLFKDKEMNRQALTEMLYVDLFPYETSYEFGAYLPPTIAQTEYTFFLQNGKPRMIETFTDSMDYGVIFVCLLNSDGTVSRQADYLN